MGHGWIVELGQSTGVFDQMDGEPAGLLTLQSAVGTVAELSRELNLWSTNRQKTPNNQMITPKSGRLVVVGKKVRFVQFLLVIRKHTWGLPPCSAGVGTLRCVVSGRQYFWGLQMTGISLILCLPPALGGLLCDQDTYKARFYIPYLYICCASLVHMFQCQPHQTLR